MSDREYEFRTAQDFAEKFPKHAEEKGGQVEFDLLGISQDLIYLAKYSGLTKADFFIVLMEMWNESGVVQDAPTSSKVN